MDNFLSLFLFCFTLRLSGLTLTYVFIEKLYSLFFKLHIILLSFSGLETVGQAYQPSGMNTSSFLRTSGTRRTAEVAAEAMAPQHLSSRIELLLSQTASRNLRSVWQSLASSFNCLAILRG